MRARRAKDQVSEPKVAKTTSTDVVLIGAGIMSATLGALLRLVEPDWSITLIERLDGAAAESSDPWNNAGTGHSALCELNYTPQRGDGTIDISKAIHVNEQFQVSRQFWASAVEHGVLPDVRSFLNPIPHVSFVRKEGDGAVIELDGPSPHRVPVSRAKIAEVKARLGLRRGMQTH